MQKEKYIRDLLEKLNNGKPSPSTYTVLQRLSPAVVLAKCWDMEGTDPEPAVTYLLEQEGKYTGAVSEEDSGIFAFVLPAFRRKGLMSAALRGTVLPHLLLQRPLLRVTLSRSAMGESLFVTAKKLALAVGFEVLRDDGTGCRLLLDGVSYPKKDFRNSQADPLTGEEKAKLSAMMAKALLYLSFSQASFEMREGRSPLSEDLLDLAKTAGTLLDRMR